MFGVKGSPMAVKALQLPLHSAADAAAIASVQPVAHDAQAVVPLLPVKRKVLYFGGNALASLAPGTWGSAAVFFSGDDKGSQPEDPAGAQRGLESPHPVLTAGSALHQGRLGRQSGGHLHLGSSWQRVGGTQTHHQAWSSFPPGVEGNQRQCKGPLSQGLSPNTSIKDETKIYRLLRMEGKPHACHP